MNMKLHSILGLFYVISVSCWLVSCADEVNKISWSYTPPNGPANWSSLFSTCGGRSQTPIDIVSADAVADATLGSFSRSIFSTPPATMLLINTGYTIQIDMTGTWQIDDPSLLPETYKAVQFHLHWGANSTNGGSEHTFNGKREFGELHIVHYNTKYPSFGEAVDKPDGLAVLGWFIKADYPQDNLEFERLLGPIRNNKILYPKDSIEINETFALETLLPCNFSIYYRYSGSLTTPDCYESVVWTMFQEPIRISARQADFLASSLYETPPDILPRKVIKDTFRNIQPLNGRTVTKSVLHGHGSASTSQISLQLFSLCVIALSFVSLV